MSLPYFLADNHTTMLKIIDDKWSYIAVKLHARLGDDTDNLTVPLIACVWKTQFGTLWQTMALSYSTARHDSHRYAYRHICTWRAGWHLARLPLTGIKKYTFWIHLEIGKDDQRKKKYFYWLLANFIVISKGLSKKKNIPKSILFGMFFCTTYQTPHSSCP